jgi:hypothetical protein
MFDQMPPAFTQEMLKMGIIAPSDQKSLYEIGKHCASKIGVPMGGAGAVMGAAAASVPAPIVGTVPGYIAGFLAGLVTGTLTCTAATYGYRAELEKLAKAQSNGF